MVRRWHVPPVIGKIESGVPTIEVVAAADYDARIRELESQLASYQAARVRDVDEKAWLSARKAELEAILRDALPVLHDPGLAERAQHALNREGEPTKGGV